MMDYSYLNQTFDSGSIDHHAQLNQQIGASGYPDLSNSVNYNLNQFKSYYLNNNLNQNHGSISSNQNPLANATSANGLLSSSNSVVNSGSSLSQTSAHLNATSPLLNGATNASLQTNRSMQSKFMENGFLVNNYLKKKNFEILFRFSL